MIERWVYYKDRWFLIRFTPDTAFIDGTQCEFIEKGTEE